LLLFQGCANKVALNIQPKEASLFHLNNKTNVGEITQRKIYIVFSDRNHRKYNPSIISDFKKALKKTLYIYDVDDKKLFIGIPGDDRGYAHNFDGITKGGGSFSIIDRESYFTFFSTIESLKYGIKENDYLSTLNLKIIDPTDLNIDVHIKILDYKYNENYFGTHDAVYIFTLLVETVDYTPLIKKYKKALAEYNVNILRNSDAADLSKFLTHDCNKALKKASDLNSIKAVEKIASLAHVSLHKKLLKSKLLPYKNKQYMKQKYYYYTHNASIEELRNLLYSNKLVGIETRKVKNIKHRYSMLIKKRNKKLTFATKKKHIQHNSFIDNSTNLVWQDNRSAKIVKKDWKYAKQYCKNLILDRENDWRLPTIQELQTIVDSKTKVKVGMQNIAYDDGYWSISEDTTDKANAWRIDFNDGDKYTFDKSYKTYVRCVRDKK
jgi:hypothetical protein